MRSAKTSRGRLRRVLLGATAGVCFFAGVAAFGMIREAVNRRTQELREAEERRARQEKNFHEELRRATQADIDKARGKR